MRLPSLIIASPFIGGFVGWMLSGSPLPMVFTVLLLLFALLGKPFGKKETIHHFLIIFFPTLALASVFLLLRLFQQGEAMATNADLPAWFLIGSGILSTAAMIALLRGSRIGDATFLLALAGGLIAFASVFQVELYVFTEWQVYPIAALPCVLLLLLALSHLRKLIPLAIAGAAASLVLSGLGMVLEKYADRLDEWIHRDETQLADYGSSKAPQLDDGRGGPDGSSRRLPRDVKLQFNDRVRIYLKMRTREQFQKQMRETLYLRTSTVTVFESDEVIAPVRNARWIYDEDDGESDLIIPLSVNQPSPNPNYTLFIEREAAYALPLLTNTTGVFASALYEFADSWYQLAPDEKIERLRYNASLGPGSSAKLPGGTLNSLRQPDGPGIYLNLPPSPLAARVTYLGETLPAYTTLEGLRGYLADHATYSLDFETPENMSPVENLLFGNKEGHCEIYAAASVMMLRALRIPSRIAYGYSGGIADPDQQLIAFRDRDFHAWAEVLTSDNEWAIFDATPTSIDAASRNPSLAPVPASDLASYENFSTTELDPDERGNSLANAFYSLSYFLSDHFIPITGAAFTLVTIFLFFRRKKKQKQGIQPLHDRSTDSTQTSSALMKELAGCGEIIGETKLPNQTWREFLIALRKEAQIPEFFEEVVAYHYRVRYADANTEPDTETNLQKQLTKWRESYSQTPT